MGINRQLLLILALSLPSAHAAEKSVCTEKELARQDCRLTVGSYNIRVLPKTLAWNDGTWRSVDNMPLKGEAVMWEKIRFEMMNGWPILQLWLWEKGVGESEVQSLHWVVASAEKRKFSLLAEGVVRKRRVERSAASPEGAKPMPTFFYDAWESHHLNLLKDGSLEWFLGEQKKTLTR